MRIIEGCRQCNKFSLYRKPLGAYPQEVPVCTALTPQQQLTNIHTIPCFCPLPTVEDAERKAFEAGQEMIWEDLEQTTRCHKYESFNEWKESRK